jgi:hypothetical protein
MVVKINFLLAGLILMNAGNSLLQAQNAKSVNVITTAVPFLRMSPDAAAGGMGNTGIATQPDANAVYWNMGKVPFAESKGAFVANYSPWLKEWASDMFLASVAGYYKLNDGEAIHATVSYFNPGALKFTDNNGNFLQSTHPCEYNIGLGYSRKLSNKVGLGIGLKYIHSNLVSGDANGSSYKAGNAVAGDIGLYFDNRNTDHNGWTFGAALTNLGTRINYSATSTEKDFIPANLGLGTSYTHNFNEQNVLIVALDINKLLVPAAPQTGDSTALANYRNKTVVNSWFSSFGDAPDGFSEELKEFQFSTGAEYWYNNQFALRAGYFYENKLKGNRKYFTAGAAVRYSQFTLNFSYLVPAGTGITKNPLANTLQFGLVFNIMK